LPKIYLLLICLIYPLQAAIAQELTILDQNTRQPLEGAVIYNSQQTLSFTTDHKGKTLLSGLDPAETITISHPSYEQYITTPNQLEKSNYQASLNQKIILIDQVVVTANRWEQDKKQTPNRIVSIAPGEIEFNNPQTSADMLAHSNQVFVQKSQLGGGSPMIRGFAANSVLIVVDGVRMNNAIFRSGNLQNVINVDPLSLENTEVLFGPGSVMYGSDALGGVMHFRTKSPGFINEGPAVLEANSVLRYSSANNERTGHIDLSVRGRKVSNFTSFTFSDFDHLTTGNKRTDKFPDYGKRFQYVQRIDNEDRVIENPDFNQQVFSGYHQLNLLNKTRLRIGSKADLGYIFNYSTTSDIPRYDRLIETDDEGNLKSADWFYGPQKWMSNGFELNLYSKNRFMDQARLALTLQNFRESRNDRDFGDDFSHISSEKVGFVTLNFDLEKNINSKNTVFYGLESFFNDVESKATETNLITGEIRPAIPRYPAGGSNYSGLAAYISHKWQPKEQVAITTGLRYNQIWLEALDHGIDTPDNGYEQLEINNGALNGSLGVAWLPLEGWQINTLLSTGFRAPNLDDMGKFFDGANGIVTVPNPQLEPEYSYSTELGVTKTILDKFKLSLTGYYTYVDNAIVQDDFSFQGSDSLYLNGELSRVQAYVNSNSAKIYGGNVQLEAVLPFGIGFETSFTVTRGKDSEHRPLRHTTPNFGHFLFSYRYKEFRAELNYRFNGKRSFEDLPLSEQQKTHLYTSDGALAWQTLNFTGSYHFNKSLALTLGIENIFDQHYLPYSSGISAPGRNFIAAIKCSL